VAARRLNDSPNPFKKTIKNLANKLARHNSKKLNYSLYVIPVPI
jgi:hypothetical protein